MIIIRLKNDVIHPGDMFTYIYQLPRVGGMGCEPVTKDVIVLEVYKHFVLVMDMKEPHLKFTIQNFDLLQSKIVNKSDCIMREYNTGKSARFKDRCI